LHGQGEHKIKIVIGGDTIKPFKSAAMTSMYDYILPVWTLEATDRLHRASAGTHPVPWLPIIDMTGKKTKRTVVAVMSSAREWADETAAVLALKHLL
jgi:hypothetical protein